MKRGEIWTVAGGNDYGGKPRPSVIIQDDAFDQTGSITVCGFTSDLTSADLFRVRVEPSEENGLRMPCSIMADKVTTMVRTKLGRRIGFLSSKDMSRLNEAIIVFLGLTNAAE
jgi:mRNA interferase MazF